jgi:hypothetical protein
MHPGFDLRAHTSGACCFAFLAEVHHPLLGFARPLRNRDESRDGCIQVKLFADVYESDIIVASPLGIATRLAEQKEDGCDFLSSIELALLFRADVMLMQNWAHVTAVFEALNQMPKQQHGTDIMRVRYADFLPVGFVPFARWTTLLKRSALFCCSISHKWDVRMHTKCCLEQHLCKCRNVCTSDRLRSLCGAYMQPPLGYGQDFELFQV